jgi:hypothetical protein
MGTISTRTRKDGSEAFLAQITVKKDGAIVHREAETFDRSKRPMLGSSGERRSLSVQVDSSRKRIRFLPP